jgi:DNA-binding PadR family transcriptional regulator
MEEHRRSGPKGIPLRVLDQVDKMNGKGWGGGIRRVLIEQSGRYTSASQVTVALKRLKHNGLIESAGQEAQSPSGGKRKFYRITELGRKTLDEEMRVYEGFTPRPPIYDKVDA